MQAVQHFIQMMGPTVSNVVLVVHLVIQPYVSLAQLIICHSVLLVFKFVPLAILLYKDNN